jgi:TPP-dependent pyruvate/acetoin dehydrogenase alpha subunit
LNAIDAEIATEIDDAAQYALDSPYPELGEVRLDVLKAEIVI